MGFLVFKVRGKPIRCLVEPP